MAQQALSIATMQGAVEGTLDVPDGARSVVLFAHGSGSSRFSPRNNYVAGELRKAGIATLLMGPPWCRAADVRTWLARLR